MTQTEERIKIQYESRWRTASYCSLLKHQTPSNTNCPVSCIISHDDRHTTVTMIYPKHAQFSIRSQFLNLNLSSCLLSSCRTDPSDINISDEMSKTTVWKSLSSSHKDTPRPTGLKKVAKQPQLTLAKLINQLAQSTQSLSLKSITYGYLDIKQC